MKGRAKVQNLNKKCFYLGLDLIFAALIPTMKILLYTRVKMRSIRVNIITFNFCFFFAPFLAKYSNI